MSLLKEIQTAAIDSTVPISDLLRKCKVLAAELDAPEFAAWVDGELNGYKDADTIPEYRILEPPSYGRFVGIGWSQVNNVPIPLSVIPEPYREAFRKVRLMQPISALAQAAQDAESGMISFPWPAEAVAAFGGKVLQGYACHSAWRSVSVSVFVGIIDTVRTRILSFVLELRKKAGKTDDAEVPQLTQQIVQQTFNATILGNVTQFAMGGSGIQQQMNLTKVDVGDLEGLKKHVADLGATEDDLKALEESVDADAKEVETSKTLGQKTASWIGKMVGKAVSGGLKIGGEVAGTVLTKLLKSYFGIDTP